MKNCFKKFIWLIVLITFPSLVFAASGISVSKKSVTVAPGSKVKVTVKASNAVGRVDVSSSSSSIATVSPSNAWLDNDSKTITITGKKEGTTTVVVKLTDVATYEGKDLSGTKITINVTVKKASSSSSSSSSKTTEKEETKEEVVEKSSNSKASSITVEGFMLETIDNTNYSLKVKNSVSSITLMAIAEDSKATIDGTGWKMLNVGENEFKITITAEDGSSTTYTVLVTRKDDTYYLTDLEDALNEEFPHIVLKEGDEISGEQLRKIKSSSKTVTLDRYEDEELIYSWIIDGKNLDNYTAFKTDINFESLNSREFDEKTGYAKGVYVGFSNFSTIPVGIKLKINNKAFKKNDDYKLYSYNDNEFKYLYDIKTLDGYLELLPTQNNYFVTKADLSEKAVSGSEIGIKELFNNMYVRILLGVVCGEFLVILILLFTRKKRIQQ